LNQTAKLVSLATAVPGNILYQEDVAEAAREMFGKRYAAFDRMAPVFLTAGIHKRHAAQPIEWYAKPHGWKERTAVYLDVAQGLFIEAANKALDAAGLDADEIDVVVTVSSTGIATPSLEARAAQAMGFRDDIQRVPVFGLGCAGGVSGFAIAARLARAQPGSNVLLVVVELCTLAFRMDQLTKAGIVACALFGDGAAACVLRAGEGGIAEVEAAGEHSWPNTLDIMGWDLDGEGFEVIFAQAIPSFAEANMGPAVAGILERAKIRMDEVDRFVCHPGGTKVVVALEQALGIPQGGLDHEREILREYGNMSAPTVLFVLDRMLQKGLPSRAVVTAMGPGFSASCVALKRAA
jgi:alkylresorcinol/alkylpyrone synthase